MQRISLQNPIVLPSSFFAVLATFCLGVSLFASSATALSPKRAAKRASAAKTITIDVVDADIRNVLRLFSDVGRLNFVIDDDVKGSVTVKLRNVQWDRALRVILKTKGLGMQKDGNIARIAPQAQLDAEQARKLDRYAVCIANAKAHTRVIAVNYADAKHMAKLVETTLTERGSVTVDERTNTLIVRDVNCKKDD